MFGSGAINNKPFLSRKNLHFFIKSRAKKLQFQNLGWGGQNLCNISPRSKNVKKIKKQEKSLNNSCKAFYRNGFTI